MQQWNQVQIHEFLLQHDVKWIFNPPTASHHTGVWERCIRTVRKVMKVLLREQVLDDEGLCMLMCEVQSIKKGRPITKASYLLPIQGGSALPPGAFSKEDNYTAITSTVSQQPVLVTKDTRVFTFITTMPKVEQSHRKISL